jgi:hypothetical protein
MKAAPSPIAASQSRRRKAQVRPVALGKETTRKAARGRLTPRQKAASGRGPGRTDSALAARLEVIAQGLGQIAEMRAELADLRVVIEKLVQTVAALINSRAEERGLEQPPSAGEEVLIVETYGVSADEEKPEGQD